MFGSVLLDSSGDFGTISLSGSGDDTFGGVFAEATFDLYGFVETIDLDPSDCCETHETGGCSNSYVKACVATRIPSCYTTEWDAACVSAVETYECGICP